MLRLVRLLLRLTRLWSRRFAGRRRSRAKPHLQRRQAFGSNPGRLEMLTYCPDKPAAAAPLVVVLHGCGQSAMGYARGAGWTRLAERHGFMLLLPQQRSRRQLRVGLRHDAGLADRDPGRRSGVGPLRRRRLVVRRIGEPLL